MRPTLFDRFLLVVLMLLLIAASLAAICMAMNIVSQDAIVSLAAIPYSGVNSAIIVGVSGVVLLIMAIRVMIGFSNRSAATANEPAPTSALISVTDIGAMRISLAAIDAMVQRHCRMQGKIKECKSTVCAVQEGVTIKLSLSLLNDTNIPEFLEGLQKSLKEYIMSMSGLNALSIEIMIVPLQNS